MDVVLAVDRHEFHHAVPEVGLIFRDRILAFLQKFEVMLDGFAAGILVVDFSLHLAKAALGFLIPGSERFVLLVVVSLVLCNMGVLVNSVLYQPRNDVQFIGQFRPLLFKSGGVKSCVPDKRKVSMTVSLSVRALFAARTNAAFISSSVR